MGKLRDLAKVGAITVPAVYTAGYMGNQLFYANLKGESLPAKAITAVKPWFPDIDLAKIKVLYEDQMPELGIISRVGEALRIAAGRCVGSSTIGFLRQILIDDSWVRIYEPETPLGWGLIGHELVHCRQWRRSLIFMPLLYLFNSKPYEDEAYAIGQEIWDFYSVPSAERQKAESLSY